MVHLPMSPYCKQEEDGQRQAVIKTPSASPLEQVQAHTHTTADPNISSDTNPRTRNGLLMPPHALIGAAPSPAVLSPAGDPVHIQHAQSMLPAALPPLVCMPACGPWPGQQHNAWWQRVRSLQPAAVPVSWTQLPQLD
eukprot:244869-Pelagomonas_calceolata.AAC.3